MPGRGKGTDSGDDSDNVGYALRLVVRQEGKPDFVVSGKSPRDPTPKESKSIEGSPDEPQGKLDQGKPLSWWHIKKANFAPLHALDFPKGRTNVEFSIKKHGVKIWEMRADMFTKDLTVNAKIHVDKNHTDAGTDYLFLRLTAGKLTFVRAYLPSEIFLKLEEESKRSAPPAQQPLQQGSPEAGPQEQPPPQQLEQRPPEQDKPEPLSPPAAAAQGDATPEPPSPGDSAQHTPDTQHTKRSRIPRREVASLFEVYNHPPAPSPPSPEPANKTIRHEPSKPRDRAPAAASPIKVVDGAEVEHDVEDWWNRDLPAAVSGPSPTASASKLTGGSRPSEPASAPQSLRVCAVSPDRSAGAKSGASRVGDRSPAAAAAPAGVRGARGAHKTDAIPVSDSPQPGSDKAPDEVPFTKRRRLSPTALTFSPAAPTSGAAGPAPPAAEAGALHVESAAKRQRLAAPAAQTVVLPAGRDRAFASGGAPGGVPPEQSAVVQMDVDQWEEMTSWANSNQTPAAPAVGRTYSRANRSPGSTSPTSPASPAPGAPNGRAALTSASAADNDDDVFRKDVPLRVAAEPAGSMTKLRLKVEPGGKTSVRPGPRTEALSPESSASFALKLFGRAHAPAAKSPSVSPVKGSSPAAAANGAAFYTSHPPALDLSHPGSDRGAGAIEEMNALENSTDGPAVLKPLVPRAVSTPAAGPAASMSRSPDVDMSEASAAPGPGKSEAAGPRLSSDEEVRSNSGNSTSSSSDGEYHNISRYTPLQDICDIDPRLLRLDRSATIGSGTFACVYRGHYRNPATQKQELVAAKVFNKTVSDATFKREYSILKAVANDYVIRMFGGSYQEPDAPGQAGERMIIMELAKAGNLYGMLYNNTGNRGRQSKLRERGVDEAFSTLERSAVTLAQQIADGMAFVHQHGMVHGDLSSMNVLLQEPRKGELVAKIADFGLACSLVNLKRDGRGATKWRAPELFVSRSGSKNSSAKNPQPYPLSQKVDVYSYGIIIWELVHMRNGQLPWNTETSDAEIARLVTRGERPPIDKTALHEIGCVHRKALDPGCWKVFMKWCWEQDPERRPTFEAARNFTTKKTIIVD